MKPSLFLLILSFVIFSCKKKDDSATTDQTTTYYKVFVDSLNSSISHIDAYGYKHYFLKGSPYYEYPACTIHSNESNKISIDNYYGYWQYDIFYKNKTVYRIFQPYTDKKSKLTDNQNTIVSYDTIQVDNFKLRIKLKFREGTKQIKFYDYKSMTDLNLLLLTEEYSFENKSLETIKSDAIFTYKVNDIGMINAFISPNYDYKLVIYRDNSATYGTLKEFPFYNNYGTLKVTSNYYLNTSTLALDTTIYE